MTNRSVKSAVLVIVALCAVVATAGAQARPMTLVDLLVISFVAVIGVIGLACTVAGLLREYRHRMRRRSRH